MQKINEKTIQKIKERIVKGAKPQKIVIFGSYAYGNPNKDSDLDIVVIKSTGLPMHKRSIEIRKLLRGISVPKDIIVYTPEEVSKWKNASSAFITTVLKNGRTIYG